MIVPITVNSRHYRIINTGIVCNVILREPKQGKKKLHHGNKAEENNTTHKKHEQDMNIKSNVCAQKTR